MRERHWNCASIHGKQPTACLGGVIGMCIIWFGLGISWSHSVWSYGAEDTVKACGKQSDKDKNREVLGHCTHENMSKLERRWICSAEAPTVRASRQCVAQGKCWQLYLKCRMLSHRIQEGYGSVRARVGEEVIWGWGEWHTTRCRGTDVCARAIIEGIDWCLIEYLHTTWPLGLNLTRSLPTPYLTLH